MCKTSVVLLRHFVSIAVVTLAIRAEAADPAPAPQATTQAPEPPRPTYPGIPPSQGKLEGTLGSFNLRVFGTVLLNLSGSDSSIVGEEVPLWALPGSVRVSFPDGTTKRAGDVHDTIFTARQSLFGFIVSPSNPSSDTWVPSGKLEFDFFGTRPVDSLQPQGRVLNQPRLRLAYFQIEKRALKITAGQDKALLAPLDPVSLSHVAIPLGATAGNLWGWFPQVRADWTHKTGDTSTVLQFGVLRPQFADPRLNDLPAPAGSSVEGAPGFGERSSQPFYQARVAVSHPMNNSNIAVGAAGHYGRERIGTDRTIESWAFAADYAVPVHRRVIWRGEAFAGSNLVPFQGGVLQGLAVLQPVATAPPTKFNRIGAGGGWTELILKATEDNKNVVYAGVGLDDPRDRHLLPGSGRSQNRFAWASYFRKLTDEVTLATEWSNWQFKTKGFVGGEPGPRGPSGRGNVFNLALAYQF